MNFFSSSGTGGGIPEMHRKRSAKKKPAPGSSVDFTVGEPQGSTARKREPISEPPSPASQKEAGIRKAARLILALGPDQAADVLRELSEAEVQRIALEITRIPALTSEERRHILESFHQEIDSEQTLSGKESLREILHRSLGEDRAQEFLEKLEERDARKDFEFLEQIEAPLLASVLQQEHPQIAAVTMSQIKPQVAASVFKNLEDEFRLDVALRIAQTTRIHPDAITRVGKVLREKFEKRKEEFYAVTGGAETLAGILNHMDRGLEENLLTELQDKDPELMQNVRERLYTFEELLSLHPKEMRLLLSRIDDDLMLASALRGAGDEMRRHFFNALSQNRAADVLDEIDNRGPVSVREINEARTYILTVARRMDEEGRIIIKKEKDDYI
ncbi:MAG: flagellar motor switch protein FliG [Leptospiraceae bacterium]